MKRPELEPIDPEFETLLDAERAASPPEEALGRVWSRLAHGTPPNRGGKGGGHAGAGGGGAWLASHIAAIGAGAFLAGTLVGAGSVIATHAEKTRIVYVERPPPPPPVAPVPTLAPSAVATPVPPSVVASPTPPSTASSPGPTPYSLLLRERSLLDAARSALSSGDSARALSLVEEHARRFAQPQLGEERETLWVQALVTSGRYDEARARAARFRASAPDSLFLPAIDASLESIP